MSGEQNVAEKIHSELGASVASRWMACPGSVQLIRQVPPAPTTEFAQEGTRAHALGELALRKAVDPDMWLGMQLEGGEVTDDMVDFVRVYTNHCRSIDALCDDDEIWIERKFNLLSLQPPAPMFGTADFVAYERLTKTLYVIDLKYGQGVVVEAKGNKQLRYYALGAALSLDPVQYPIDTVVMTIVQPRAAHTDGPIRSDEISFVELVEFAADLIDCARKTQDPQAPLHAGSHCRFCPAAAQCPEKLRYAQAVAQIEFGVEASVPPAPEALPMATIVEWLPKLDVLESWIKACRGRVFGALERGEDVPGYKLVAKRALRKWGDETVAAQYLEATGNYAGEEIYEPKSLRSPAQIEKLMGKKTFASSPIAAIVEKKSSGYNMAPVSDPRPAVSVTAGEEFLTLPSGSESE